MARTQFYVVLSLRQQPRDRRFPLVGGHMNVTIAIRYTPRLADIELWRQMGTIVAMSMLPRKPDLSAACVEDTHVIAGTLGGDHESFGRIVEKYQSTIAQQMCRFSRQPAVVEELVHDVFVQAFVSLRSYRSTAPLLHWLRKIAVRTGYRYWNRTARERKLTIPLSEIAKGLELLTSGNLTTTESASELLGDLLDQLSPRDRLVLTLLYWDNCSVAEAADLSGWTQTMVKVQAFRARKQLKRLIDEARS